jgi:hypothetical protein
MTKTIVKKHRLFFKDFDGAIIEVNQKHAVIKKSELAKLKSMFSKGSGATSHGEFQSPELMAVALQQTENHINGVSEQLLQ